MSEGSAAWVAPERAAAGRHEPPRRTRRDPVWDADRIAVQLRRALDRVAIPLARAATGFVARKGWVPFGYARLEDHARERFDRSGRWVRDLAALGKALETMPQIGDALVGADGYRPLGRVAALVVARVAAPASVDRWIDLARAVTVRELKIAAARARESASTWPGSRDAEESPPGAEPLAGASENGGDGGGLDEAEPGRLVRFLVPEPVLVAFDETLALHRAVSGQEVTVTSFVEALVAEGFAGPNPPDADCVPLGMAPDEATIEKMMARVTDNWVDLEPLLGQDDTLAVAVSMLERLESCSRLAGDAGPAEIDRQIRTLIRLEDELERHLGRVLRDLGDRGGWSRLLFRGAGHYAEQRLGLARRTLQGRAMLARALRRFPRLRQAYECGDVGFEAALLVVRTLGRGPADEATESDWVDRARECTVKRLRDERRAHGRGGAMHVSGDRGESSAAAAPGLLGARRPLSDAEWHASIRLEPGLQRDRVYRLGFLAAERRCADVFLRLRLPDDLAASFLAAVESVKRHLENEVEVVPWDQPWPDPEAPPSLLAARMFSIRCRRVPAWVGLLAVLEDYVSTWDDPEGMPKRAADRIYARDGWRCTAPGCTSRRNLEDHHLDYRSRGGGNDPSNRTTLCRFHHQLGEHGVLASCRGTAPLGIRWRLGREEIGVHYRNERVVGGGRMLNRVGGESDERTRRDPGVIYRDGGMSG